MDERKKFSEKELFLMVIIGIFLGAMYFAICLLKMFKEGGL